MPKKRKDAKKKKGSKVKGASSHMPSSANQPKNTGEEDLGNDHNETDSDGGEGCSRASQEGNIMEVEEDSSLLVVQSSEVSPIKGDEQLGEEVYVQVESSLKSSRSSSSSSCDEADDDGDGCANKNKSIEANYPPDVVLGKEVGLVEHCDSDVATAMTIETELINSVEETKKLRVDNDDAVQFESSLKRSKSSNSSGCDDADDDEVNKNNSIVANYPPGVGLVKEVGLVEHCDSDVGAEITIESDLINNAEDNDDGVSMSEVMAEIGSPINEGIEEAVKDSDVAAVITIESGLINNVEEMKNLCVDNDDGASVSEVMAEMGSPIKEGIEEAVKDSATQENGVQSIPPPSPPHDHIPSIISNGTDAVKISDVLHFSDTQLLVAGSGVQVQPRERTSWKTCCGLFELFTGSNR
ncbi:unnamed protein product [Cuscuta epithymum]|uniref:Uncharacterized protein n=1 Tax=Cuscuta epithymum TaxID=186058 RepID=A0AAV0FQU4_9ASTE|nr:unnamed protein product [Cuscuta epithymum]